MLVLLLKAFVYVTVLLLAGYAAFYLALGKRGRKETGAVLPAIFVGLAFLCFFSPSPWLLYLAAFALIPVLARTRRDVAIMLTIVLIATPPFQTIWVFEGLKLVRWNVQNALTLGGLFAFAIARGPIIRRKPRADLPLLLLVALLVIVAARESSFTNFLRETVTVLLNVALPYWVITRGIDPLADSRKLMLWITGAATMIATVATYEAVTRWPLYRVAGALFDQHGSGMFVMRMGLMRATSTLANSTVLGYVLSFAFIAALLARRSFRSPLHHGGVVIIIAAGIVASQSRGAMLGAGAGLVLLTLFNPRSRTILPAVLSVGCAAIFALLIVVLTRFETTAADTIDYRRQLMARGLQEFRRHPLSGDTIVAVTDRMRDLTTGEQIVDFVNTYLYFALFSGAFGALIFLLVLLIPPIGLWRRRRRLPADPDCLALARLCFAFLLATALMLAFTSLSDRMTALLISVAGLAGTILAPARKTERIGQTLAAEPDLPGLPRLETAGRDTRLPALREQELPGL